jgi:hypothetical protein
MTKLISRVPEAGLIDGYVNWDWGRSDGRLIVRLPFQRRLYLRYRRSAYRRRHDLPAWDAMIEKRPC